MHTAVLNLCQGALTPEEEAGTDTRADTQTAGDLHLLGSACTHAHIRPLWSIQRSMQDLSEGPYSRRARVTPHACWALAWVPQWAAAGLQMCRSRLPGRHAASSPGAVCVRVCVCVCVLRIDVGCVCVLRDWMYIGCAFSRLCCMCERELFDSRTRETDLWSGQ